ncbi:EAL domain-containing protein [Pseudoalteromonas sp. McH1-7]|uniref:bifunctional diguanylate cyclase/phosphodiesterase n=1 Tax=unclassified Pseudoalteromonas TaxID=194690 RepID=UPI000FFE41BD|nr:MULTISPECIES: EAL domain-containing protein [unclassified Pseudoalteromonas]NUZ10723.1 EAL domain-containing protein [Pseudoalteromonas sp. McH1-7]RXF00208.1 EAL domain-containing protein [Pseudoalteromonas sp. PS5]
MNNSFKHKIISLCIALILLTAGISLASFWWSTSKFNEAQVQRKIQVAQNVYQQYLKARERLLVTAATVLTADFGFKQAVATRDAQTISSVLLNHSRRIDADLMLLLDVNGDLISANAQGIEVPSDIRTWMQVLKNHQDHSAFVVLSEQLYQVIILPVRAPRTIAYSVIGFEVGKSVAEELKELTGMESSFVGATDKLKASSVAGLSLGSDLFAFLESQKTTRWLGEYAVYKSAEVNLPSLESNPISLVLSADLTTQYQEFDKMVFTIILLSTATILLGFITSGIVAKNLTTPLSKLTELAKRFAKGDYSAKLEESRPTQEICQLVDAFNEMGEDIQEREEQIRFQASHDYLTGFYNRNAALDKLHKVLAGGTEYYFIAIDIKGLRHINDKLGPRVGDDCIKAVAQRIAEINASDTGLNVRLGGDEFLVAHQAQACEDPQQAVLGIVQCAQRLNQDLSQPYMVQGLDISLRFSIGVVHYPKQAHTPEDVVRRALIAVDTAAHDGHEVYYYQSGEDEAHLERLQIIDELRQAINSDDGQLFMTYQPKLNMKSNRIDKVEALIRWQRNNGEWVSPELFIDLAEQSGLIVDLTQWVLNTVIAQVSNWSRQGEHIKAAINVSAQDIIDKDFLPHLQSLLQRHKVQPELITIELTERDMIENEEKGISVLQALKRLGVQVSLDDYGVGQTSLGRLKMLPIDELKLDKVFILKLAQSEKDQFIVNSTITLGHQLGFSVVAEGVEDKASLELLADMQCDYAQGYYLSKPLKADDFDLWLGRYHEVG